METRDSLNAPRSDVEVLRKRHIGDENLLCQSRETSPEPSPRVVTLRVPVPFLESTAPVRVYRAIALRAQLVGCFAKVLTKFFCVKRVSVDRRVSKVP